MLCFMVLIRQISGFLLRQECFVYGNEFHHRTSLAAMYLFEQCGGLEKQLAKLVAHFHLFPELIPALLHRNTSEPLRCPSLKH